MGAMFGAYAGAFAWIAFIAGWIVLFGPCFAKDIDQKQRLGRLLIPTVALMATVVGVVAFLPRWLFMGRVVSAIPLLVLVAVATCAVMGLFKGYRPALAMVVAAGVSAIVAAPVLIAFSRTAYEMWDREVDAGSSQYVDELGLAGIHVLFIIACIVLTVVLWLRGSKGVTGLSALASFLFVLCISSAFFWTVPRGGNEGALMWLFIVPAFPLSALPLLITSVVNLITAARRWDYAARWGPYKPYGEQP